MFGGVVLCGCPDVTEDASVRDRVRISHGRSEVYFLLTDPDRILPVYQSGTTQILPWGARRNHWARLPASPWLRLDDLEAGRLSHLHPGPAVVRASRAVDNGIWFEVIQGIRAVLVHEGMLTVVYPLIEPASPYYRGMTGSEWMPCLVRQRI